MSSLVYADPPIDPSIQREIDARQGLLRPQESDSGRHRRQDIEPEKDLVVENVKKVITDADKKEALGYIRRRIVQELIVVEDGKANLAPIMSSMGFGAATEEVLKAVLFQLAHEVGGSGKDLDILDVIADYPEILSGIKTAQDLVDAYTRDGMSLSLPQANMLEGVAQLERGTAKQANLASIVQEFVSTAAFQSWSPETLKIYVGKELADLDVALLVLRDCDRMMQTNPFFNFGTVELSSIRTILRAYQLAQKRGDADKTLFIGFWYEISKIAEILAQRNQTVDGVLKMFSLVIQKGVGSFGAQLASPAKKIDVQDGTLGDFGSVLEPLEIGGFTAKSHLVTQVVPFYKIAQQVSISETAILDAVREVVGAEEFERLYETDQIVYQLPKSGFVLYDMSDSGDLVLTHVLGTEIVVISGFGKLISESSPGNPLKVTKENVAVLSRDVDGIPLKVEEIFSREHDSKKPSISNAARATYAKQLQTRGLRAVHENPQEMSNVVEAGGAIARGIRKGLGNALKLLGIGREKGEPRAEKAQEGEEASHEGWVKRILRGGGSSGRRGGSNSVRGM